MAYLGILSLILISTALAGHFSRRIGIPAVIGQLLVGIVLGPAVLGWVQGDTFVHMFSEIGVIILMFIAGLESNLELLKKYIKPAFSVAITGVILPLCLIFLTGKLFDFHMHEAIFLGVVFSATSVSISVEVLKELGYLESKEGMTILGAAVIDDILAVIILSTFVSLFGSAATSSEPKMSFLITLLLQVLYFVGIYFVVKWIAPYLMSLSEKIFVPSAVILMSLVIGLGMAYIAELVGLSGVVGAFFAGIAIGQTPYKTSVDHSIEPIGYAVFIPVFFVSIGLNMTFDGLGKDLLFIISLTVVAVLTKWLGCGMGAKVAGMDYNSGDIIGAGMVSRGEMALIIAQLGYESKLLSADYYSSIILVIILTTLIAPFMLKAAVKRKKKAAK